MTKVTTKSIIKKNHLFKKIMLERTFFTEDERPRYGDKVNYIRQQSL